MEVGAGVAVEVSYSRRPLRSRERGRERLSSPAPNAGGLSALERMARRHARPMVFLAVIIAGSSVLAAQAGDPQAQPSQEEQKPSQEEQKDILAWLERSSDSLNTYGDPADAMYMGGSPLFNERTGEFKDKFQYIIEHVSVPSPESLLAGGHRARVC